MRVHRGCNGSVLGEVAWMDVRFESVFGHAHPQCDYREMEIVCHAGERWGAQVVPVRPSACIIVCSIVIILDNARECVSAKVRIAI